MCTDILLHARYDYIHIQFDLCLRATHFTPLAVSSNSIGPCPDTRVTYTKFRLYMKSILIDGKGSGLLHIRMSVFSG